MEATIGVIKHILIGVIVVLGLGAVTGGLYAWYSIHTLGGASADTLTNAPSGLAAPTSPAQVSEKNQYKVTQALTQSATPATTSAESTVTPKQAQASVQNALNANPAPAQTPATSPKAQPAPAPSTQDNQNAALKALQGN